MKTADVKPSVEVAERVLRVLKAFDISPGSLRCSWEWIRIAEAAAIASSFYLSSNTNFFNNILTDEYNPSEAKEVYDLIEPYITLSDRGKERLMDFHSETGVNTEPATPKPVW